MFNIENNKIRQKKPKTIHNPHNSWKMLVYILIIVLFVFITFFKMSS